jgi:hypothetical protein
MPGASAMDIDGNGALSCLFAEEAANICSGVRFLQLARDQVLGMLCIAGAKWSQSDRSTTFWDDHKVRPHQEVGLHGDIIDVGQRNGCP